MAAECWKVHYQYNRIDFVEPIEGESIGHNLSRFEKKKNDTLPHNRSIYNARQHNTDRVNNV